MILYPVIQLIAFIRIDKLAHSAPLMEQVLRILVSLLSPFESSKTLGEILMKRKGDEASENLIFARIEESSMIWNLHSMSWIHLKYQK